MMKSADIARAMDQLNRPAPAEPFSDRDEALLRSIVSQPWEAPRGGRPARRVQVRVAVLVAAFVGLSVVGVKVGNHELGAAPAAAEVLNKAAGETLSAADPTVGPDQYLRVTQTTDGWSTDLTTRPETNARFREVVRTWIPGSRPDGWKPIRQVTSSRPGETTAPQPLAQAPDSMYLDPTFYGKLPTDPEALLSYLRTRQEGQPDGDAFHVVQPILESGLASAELRAGIFKALASSPEIKTITDPPAVGGREGIAVKAWDFYLIFDRASFAYLGSLRPEGDSTDLTRFTATSVETDVVDRPPGDLGPSNR